MDTKAPRKSRSASAQRSLESPLTWSRTRPTAEGYWWMRSKSRPADHYITRVEPAGKGLRVPLPDGCALHNLEFAGPIPAPAGGAKTGGAL